MKGERGKERERKEGRERERERGGVLKSTVQPTTTTVSNSMPVS